MGRSPVKIPELVINWHIREQCNYSCYFCYAKYAKHSEFTNDFPAVLREISSLPGRTISLRDIDISVGAVRVNFAGGEPFLEKRLPEAIELSHELGLMPSFITNGSLLKDSFVIKHGTKISVAGFSIDSLSKATNAKIGRQGNKGDQFNLDRLQDIFTLFRKISPETQLKINTVVCRENYGEDFTLAIKTLSPDKWKLLRVIPIHGATGMGITDDQYQSFIDRHISINTKIVTEDNHEMHRSYLMMNPSGQFYQRDKSEYLDSDRVSHVGIMNALRSVEFDASAFLSRY